MYTFIKQNWRLCLTSEINKQIVVFDACELFCKYGMVEILNWKRSALLKINS